MHETKIKKFLSISFLLIAISFMLISVGSHDKQIGTFSRVNPTASIENIENSDIVALGDSYQFIVQNETVNLFIQHDGKITVEYLITFINDIHGAPIEYVDVGFSTNNLDRANAFCELIIGSETYNIPSDYIKPPDTQYIEKGTTVEIFRVQPIQSGETGIFHLIINMSGQLYTDTENSSMASFEFSPTWFGKAYAGSTIFNYQLTFYFPPNENDGNLLKWHEKPLPWVEPEYGLANFTSPSEQRLFYRWTYSSISQEKHVFGASFPKSWVANGVVQSAPLDPAIISAIWIGLIAFGAISVIVSISYLAYKYKQKIRTQYYPPVGKKKSPLSSIFCCAFWFFVILVIYFIDSIEILIFSVSIGIIVAGFAFLAYFIARAIDKRRLVYEKPKLSIECVGVNKTLSVPEAAIIKNTPLKKVIFLILFGMIKKNIIAIKTTEPLTLEIKKALDPNKKGQVDEKGRKIRQYELDFYNAINKKTGKISEEKIRNALIKMIKETYKKMTGFNLRATVIYYNDIMNKAWKQVKKSRGAIKLEDIEDEFEFMILDDHFNRKAKEVFSNRIVYVPSWYNNYYYWRRPGVIIPPGSGFFRTGSGSMNFGSFNMGEFANSIASGIENISNNIANNVSKFFDNIIKTVSPPPKPSSSSGSSGRSYGGYSCACACACACAGCACACAGGGR
ncbi:MAG: hypothetical protein ACTSVI_11275 [Promethearchaeota archaeon]